MYVIRAIQREVGGAAGGKANRDGVERLLEEREREREIPG